MDALILEWINLNVKWIHLIVGIAWIGASFYFNWLEGNLERGKAGLNKGVAGDLWAVHGGGFYHVEKFEVAPEKLPTTLHWFKWEAYLTWISGFALLVLVFYISPHLYLIDKSVADITAFQAISISLASLLISWLAYDQLCKSSIGHNNALVFWIVFGALTLEAYLLSQVFSPRAAYIQMGAVVGTIMVANVFFSIIPSQQKMVSAMEAGQVPDGSVGKKGFQRSFHNNYFTLPVLFIMLSGHYPQTFGNDQAWLVLAAISLIGVLTRHYFNLKNRGKVHQWMLPLAASLMVVLAYLTFPKTPEPTALTSNVTFAQIAPIMELRCATCHAAAPTDLAFKVAPKGVELDTQAKIEQQVDAIYAQTIATHAMPIGNLTQMTPDERALLAAWITQFKAP
ncbi:urate hydroxylase PuuD [Thiosulfativibrio zosterae]|uniref:Cytochrome c domain-containing protein n=1 Tax=Thiosulfativibrio zosterae TaxID=2675053 RepID=A0A6F8PP45_9GAMM|nr:urate hydroxylase PuuD [Thiosulfativibrio zosterae]BBP43883.1 hypothetical protein THMIRHAT_16290 [Thiosulfativibrio zosterae]